MWVSIILPTYNESDNLWNVLIISELLWSSKEEFEILIIDDNSPDKTWYIAKQKFEHLPNIKVIIRDNRTSLSSAIYEWIQLTQYNYNIVLDIDWQHNFWDITKILWELKLGKDLVIWSRYIDNQKIFNNNKLRQIISKIWILITRPLSKWIKDSLSWFFWLDKRIIGFNNPYLIWYKFLLEIIVRWTCDRYSEVPIEFGDREQWKSKFWVKEIIRFLQLVARLYIYKISLIFSSYK